MFKILLVENDIIQIKKILDYLNNINININFKIYGIAYSIQEIFNILLIEDFDMILLDYNTVNNDFNNFFKFIHKNNLKKYKKSIILLHNDKENILNSYNRFYIYNCLETTYIQQDFKRNIIEFFKINKKSIVIDKIKTELKMLNFKNSYIGTKYLIDCIYQVYLKGNKYDFHLFKDILPIIARKYNKSIDCIYGSIKTAIKNMYLDCKDEILLKYFKNYEISKPKPKELITSIINNISTT